jgi:hypothetical protein
MTTNFHDCPVCGGDPYGVQTPQGYQLVDHPCTNCGKSGVRSVNKESVELALSAREWLDAEIEACHRKWCHIHGFDKAPRMVSWSIREDELHVTVDTSVRRNGNTDTHILKLAYLYTAGEERTRMMTDDLNAEKTASGEIMTLKMRARREELLRELAELDAALDRT